MEQEPALKENREIGHGTEAECHNDLQKGNVMKCLGIEIERKTNIVSLVAFILSVAAIFAQVYAFMRGPDVKFFPPDEITIRAEKIGEDVHPVFIAALAYDNKGHAGYNTVLRHESVKLTIAGKSYIYKWRDFVSTVIDEKYNLDVKGFAVACPTTINAGSTLSHQTRFVPLERGETDEERFKNYLKWQDFLDALTKVSEFELEFTFQVLDKKPEIRKIKVSVDGGLKYYLPKNGWYSAPCWEDRVGAS